MISPEGKILTPARVPTGASHCNPVQREINFGNQHAVSVKTSIWHGHEFSYFLYIE